MFANDELLFKFLMRIQEYMWSFQLDQDCFHWYHLLCIYLFALMLASGCSLLKHAFDIHEIVAPVSDRDIVLFLLIVTGKFMAYFMLPHLTLMILSVHDSHAESDEESRLLSGLLESWGPKYLQVLILCF